MELAVVSVTPSVFSKRRKQRIQFLPTPSSVSGKKILRDGQSRHLSLASSAFVPVSSTCAAAGYGTNSDEEATAQSTTSQYIKSPPPANATVYPPTHSSGIAVSLSSSPQRSSISPMASFSLNQCSPSSPHPSISSECSSSSSASYRDEADSHVDGGSDNDKTSRTIVTRRSSLKPAIAKHKIMPISVSPFHSISENEQAHATFNISDDNHVTQDTGIPTTTAIVNTDNVADCTNAQQATCSGDAVVLTSSLLASAKKAAGKKSVRFAETVQDVSREGSSRSMGQRQRVLLTSRRNTLLPSVPSSRTQMPAVVDRVVVRASLSLPRLPDGSTDIIYLLQRRYGIISRDSMSSNCDAVSGDRHMPLRDTRLRETVRCNSGGLNDSLVFGLDRLKQQRQNSLTNPYLSATNVSI